MTPLFETINWRAFDAYRPTGSPDLLDVFNGLLGRPSTTAQSHSLYLLREWYGDYINDIGRLAALPDAVRCYADLLAVVEPSLRATLLYVIEDCARCLPLFNRYRQWHGETPFQFALRMRNAFIDTIPMVLPMIDDAHTEVRCAAAKVLGRLACMKTRSALLDRLATEEVASLQFELLHALASIPAPDLNALAEKYLAAEDVMTRTQAMAMRALYDTPYPNRSLAELVQIAFPLNDFRVPPTAVLATSVVEDMSAEARSYVVDAWCDNIENVRTADLDEYFHHFIVFEFRSRGAEPIDTVTKHMLSDNELTVLSAWVRCERYWTADNAEWEARRSSRHRVFKVPMERSQMAALVQIEYR